MNKLFLKGLMLVVSTCAYVSVEKKANEGIVILRSNLFTYDSNKSIFQSNFKIWYYDSLAIEQITSINFYEDTAGRRTQDETVLGFIFVDFRSGTYNCYKTFSDTATAIKKSKSLDSISIDGGSNFYFPKHFRIIGVPETLSDTTIDQKLFKRIKIKREINNKILITIGYFLCSAQSAKFTFDKELSSARGCPLVRLDDFPENKNFYPTTSEYIFISNKLSEKELKVFEAWARDRAK